MNVNAVLAGASQGNKLVEQRNTREQKLRQLQEQHNANMEQKAQVKDQNELKLEQQEIRLDELKKSLFRRDSDDALDSWASTGDATLFKNLKDDPQFKRIYGDIVDIQTAKEVKPGDLADQILLENGVSTSDIAKMSPEDKEKVVQAAGEHIMILTKADGTKHTTNLEELTAMSGRTSRADKLSREMYTKAIIAGGAKRALALAEYNGDTEKIKSLTDTLKTIGAYTEKTTSKDPAFVTKAKYMVQAEGGDPTDSTLVAKKVAELETTTAKQKNLNAEAAIMAQGVTQAKDITAVRTPSELSAVINTPSVLKTRKLELDALNKDKKYKKSVEAFTDTINSIVDFNNVLDSIKAGKIEANAMTKLQDMGEAMVNNKKDAEFWSSNPGMRKQFTDEAASMASKRMSNDILLQKATLAVIKSMSGLAVTNEEREMYLKMLGAGNTQATRKVLIAAQTFINAQKSTLNTFTDMLASEYPVTGAVLKQQVVFATNKSHVKNSSGKNIKVDDKQVADAVKNKKILLKSLIDSMGK
jgi:hypothetical protein